jgi:hypothetical protein
VAKGERDWAQLDAFEVEYRERLVAEKKRSDSPFLTFLRLLAEGVEEFSADEVKGRDEETRRLFALRGKILSLRAKVGLPEERILESEKAFLPKSVAKPPVVSDSIPAKKPRIKYIADPAPEGYLYPVTFDDIRAILAELPPEHVAPIHEIRLSNQKRTGADGDWWDGEIRLHCLMQKDSDGRLRRPLGRTEGGQDVERFGGTFQFEGNKLYAVWPVEAYRTFILRRVLIHEVAHGVAELPGYADAVRRAGSVEKFCEQYAENLYSVPMPNPGKGRGSRM